MTWDILNVSWCQVWWWFVLWVLRFRLLKLVLWYVFGCNMWLGAHVLLACSGFEVFFMSTGLCWLLQVCEALLHHQEWERDWRACFFGQQMGVKAESALNSFPCLTHKTISFAPQTNAKLQKKEASWGKLANVGIVTHTSQFWHAIPPYCSASIQVYICLQMCNLARKHFQSISITVTLLCTIIYTWDIPLDHLLYLVAKIGDYGTVPILSL